MGRNFISRRHDHEAETVWLFRVELIFPNSPRSDFDVAIERMDRWEAWEECYVFTACMGLVDSAIPLRDSKSTITIYIPLVNRVECHGKIVLSWGTLWMQVWMGVRLDQAGDN